MAEWLRFQITYISKDRSVIRFGDKEFRVNPSVMSQFQTLDVIEVQVNGTQITAIQWPPGKEPGNGTNGNGKKPVQTPAEKPVVKQTEPVKTPDKPPVENNKPVSKPIEQSQEKPPEPVKNGNNPYNHVEGSKSGGGPISRIDLDMPFLEYTFKYKDKQTDELKEGVSKFTFFSDAARKTLSEDWIKPGVEIDVKYGYFNGSQVAVEIKPREKRKGSKSYDPITEQIKNLSILHESILDKSLEWKKFCIEQGIETKSAESGWYEIVDRSVQATDTIYNTVEKRIKGGRS